MKSAAHMKSLTRNIRPSVRYNIGSFNNKNKKLFFLSEFSINLNHIVCIEPLQIIVSLNLITILLSLEI